MLAIRVQSFGDPEVLRVEEVPTPTPGPGQVLVRLRAAGVNPVEAYIRSGAYAALPTLPYTPGGDGAGEVEAVGGGVSRVQAGDRVYVISGGTYAQYAVCSEEHVFALPDGVSYAQGAAIGVPYATAVRAYWKTRARAGDWVLVHGGSGGVGVAAVQIARAQGMRTVATAGTPEGLAMLREIGADAAVAHDAAAQALAATGGRGFDIVLEMAAHVGLSQALGLLAPGGRAAVIGSRGPVEVNPRDLMGREASVQGILLFLADEEDLRRMHAEIGAGLRDGSLRPVAQRRFALAEAAAAHRAVLAPGALGKITLEIP